MRGAPLRIGQHPNQIHLGGAAGSQGSYAEAVTKLIPGEVVAAYLAGKALLQASAPPAGISAWIAWTVFCIVMVVVIRVWMTSDKDSAVPPQWSAVIVSALCSWSGSIRSATYSDFLVRRFGARPIPALS